MNKGLVVKYEVRKKSSGALVDGCFVLRPEKDAAARVALRAYAEHTDNASLSADIIAWLSSIESIESPIERDLAELEASAANRGYNIRYIENEAKRTVVALLEPVELRCHYVDKRGIAKCGRRDTFDPLVGRVVALKRALGHEFDAFAYGSSVSGAYGSSVAQANDSSVVREVSQGIEVGAIVEYTSSGEAKRGVVTEVRVGDCYVINPMAENEHHRVHVVEPHLIFPANHPVAKSLASRKDGEFYTGDVVELGGEHKDKGSIVTLRKPTTSRWGDGFNIAEGTWALADKRHIAKLVTPRELRADIGDANGGEWEAWSE